MDLPEEDASNAAWEVSNSGRRSGLGTNTGWIRARCNHTVLGVLSKSANDHQGACPTLVRVNCLDRESKKGLYFLSKR